MPRVDEAHPQVDRRVDGPATARRRPLQRGPTRADAASPRVAGKTPPPSSPTAAPRIESNERAFPDRGLGLLIMFTAGVLVMVGLIVFTGAIARWWMLAPVMAVDLAVTAAVLAAIVRLLND